MRANVIERAVRLSPARVGVAVVYHSVAAAPGDPMRELVPAQGAELFEAQLRFLRDRYRVVAASELPEAAAMRRRGEPVPVAITFDDDLRSHLEVAAPILRRLGLPATFFLCGASLDSPFAFWWERLQRAFDAGAPGLADLAGLSADGRPTVHELGEAIEAMSPDERDHTSRHLLELAGPDPLEAGLRREHVWALCEAGFEIGFHTLRHDRLPDLTDAQLEAALASGREALAEAAGIDPAVIAYPHGRADQRVARAARASGYALGFTDWPIPTTRRSDPLLLGRLVPSPYSVSYFGAQLAKVLVRAFIPFARPSLRSRVRNRDVGPRALRASAHSQPVR